MRKLSTFILLLIQMNYFMFLPQMPEADSYDVNGQQTDDVNSVVEYVSVVFGFDKTADDEDNDNGNSFTVVKACDYLYQQQITILPESVFTEVKNSEYAVHKDHMPELICYGIITPPPEA